MREIFTKIHMYRCFMSLQHHNWKIMIFVFLKLLQLSFRLDHPQFLRNTNNFSLQEHKLQWAVSISTTKQMCKITAAVVQFSCSNSHSRHKNTHHIHIMIKFVTSYKMTPILKKKNQKKIIILHLGKYAIIVSLPSSFATFWLNTACHSSTIWQVIKTEITYDLMPCVLVHSKYSIHTHSHKNIEARNTSLHNFWVHDLNHWPSFLFSALYHSMRYVVRKFLCN
jgi:hypothetical protein